jgi:20S proteasome subunit alpha 7
LQAYTLYSSVRPFGLSVVLAGWDSPVSTAGSDTIVERKAEGKPALYMIEPSGTYCVRPSEFSRDLLVFRRVADSPASLPTQGYRGVATGKGKTEAKTEIEKLALDEMTVEEALVEAARMQVSDILCAR